MTTDFWQDTAVTTGFVMATGAISYVFTQGILFVKGLWSENKRLKEEPTTALRIAMENLIVKINSQEITMTKLGSQMDTMSAYITIVRRLERDVAAIKGWQHFKGHSDNLGD